MWLISLGLHGLLLVIPIPATETPELTKKPQELVKLTPVTPSPSPKIKTSPTPATTNRPKTPQQRRQVASTIVKKSPSPVIASSPQKQITPPRPVVASTPQKPVTPVAVDSLPQGAEIEIDTKNQELLPTPQAIPLVSPSLVTIATNAINGVPVDPSWQAVEQPNEVMAESEMFTQPDGTLHPDIVGKVAQIPNKSPDTVFDEFFSLQLENANFNVEHSGTYAQGGGLYKLTPKDNSPILYLALAPDKQGTGTVVTIWIDILPVSLETGIIKLSDSLTRAARLQNRT
jgi:hypothetical protein